MSMDLQTTINSRLGVAFALALSRLIPPPGGRRLADFLADRVAAHQTAPMVQAVRANQLALSGGHLSPEQLGCAVQATFRHTGRCLYDLYHHLNRPSMMLDMVAFDAQLERYMKRFQAAEEGTVVVGPHLSNFDLAGRAAALRGLSAQVISFPQPGGSYKWQNEMRRSAGLDITPASIDSLRRATRRLQAGGTVLTGLDRPVADPKYRPLFFGRPASIPVVHVSLALKARVPILVTAVVMRPDGVYHILTSDLIYMRPFAGRYTEIMRNAETVLQAAETFIRQAPQQWLMFYPVWPESRVVW